MRRTQAHLDAIAERVFDPAFWQPEPDERDRVQKYLATMAVDHAKRAIYAQREGRDEAADAHRLTSRRIAHVLKNMGYYDE